MNDKLQTLNSCNDFSPKIAAILFWSLSIFFAALWVILPALFHSAYRMRDVIELQCIAPEWILSTQKHPMLSAWLLGLVNIFTNKHFVSPFIASQICVLISLWSVWQLGRRVLSEKLALLGVLAVLPYYFFSYHSLVYNPNMVLIAFWTLSVYLVFQAIQTNRILYWVLSGISIGIAFHAKYPAALLVFSMLIFMFSRPETRKQWRGIGPYLTTIIAILIFLPHIIWLYQRDFITLFYANYRFVYSNQIYRLLLPSAFTAYQIQYLITTVIVLFPALGFVWQWRFKQIDNNDQKRCADYLFYCFMIPFLICIIISATKNTWLSVSYAAPFWTYFGVWLLLKFKSKELPTTLFRSIKLVIVLEVVMVILLVCGVIAPHIDGKPKKQLFATKEFGVACDRIWASRFDVPVAYVTGDWSICGYACYAMSGNPRLHFFWNIYDGGISDMNATPTGLWSTDDDLNQKGGMIVWNLSEKNHPNNYVPDWVHKRFPNAEVIHKPIILPYKTRVKIPPVKIGVAVIPPKK
ncbi:MAG: glycosyltransferase family 39 protein [Planctomycetaceae bacterium]|jgi:hypothetical protein|nr:glycosyltransferase family 39 protein [Planctomycetaceae bacterium]